MVLGGRKVLGLGFGCKTTELLDSRSIEARNAEPSLGPHAGGLSSASRVYERSNRLVGINCKRIPGPIQQTMLLLII